MSYIQELRKLVGSRPVIVVGTAVLVLKGNQVLLERRTDDGLWGLPGGSLEPGETLEEAARRELLEETGLEATGSLHLFNLYSGKPQFCQYPNGDQTYYVCVAYWLRDFRGTLRVEAEEVLELGFYATDDLPGDLTPSERPILNELEQAANGWSRRQRQVSRKIVTLKAKHTSHRASRLPDHPSPAANWSPNEKENTK